MNGYMIVLYSQKIRFFCGVLMLVMKIRHTIQKKSEFFQIFALFFLVGLLWYVF